MQSLKAQKLFEAVRANSEAEVNTHLSGASKADVNYLAKVWFTAYYVQ